MSWSTVLLIRSKMVLNSMPNLKNTQQWSRWIPTRMVWSIQLSLQRLLALSKSPIGTTRAEVVCWMLMRWHCGVQPSRKLYLM
jgi:hypothetical protein